ncbi:unnamed protein product [Mytilus edulis]|uniref:Reverse transcriptase n=1 Tax=Mytilus edulis TaxID=6550 RepID=A0A8S3PT26_MYTED|nr:unnamed protein product [Mytilus edulis]
MVRDRIVIGTKSSKEKLINEGSELTLEKAFDIARPYELSQRQLQTMNIGEDPNVNNDSSNPVVHPLRKVSVSLKGRIKTELDRMMKLGVIVRQKEPTAWVNSMVTVVKSSGDETVEQLVPDIEINEIQLNAYLQYHLRNMNCLRNKQRVMKFCNK